MHLRNVSVLMLTQSFFFYVVLFVFHIFLQLLKRDMVKISYTIRWETNESTIKQQLKRNCPVLPTTVKLRPKIQSQATCGLYGTFSKSSNISVNKPNLTRLQMLNVHDVGT